MGRVCHRLVAVVFVLIWAGCALAAELPKEAADTRLDRRITYKTDAKSLPLVLADISKATGVKLSVSAGARFWSVRQRKVALYLKDMPLREFIPQLEKLLDYHFTRSGKPGEYAYTIWQDLNGRTREQRTLTAQQELREKHKRRAVDETLRDAELALMMSPKDAEAIKGKNPWLAYLAGTPRGRAYSGLLTAIPREQYDRLFDARSSGIWLRMAQLSPQVKQALQKIGASVNPEAIKKQYPDRDPGSLDIVGFDVFPEDFSSNDPTPGVPFWLYVLAAADKPNESIVADAFAIARSDVSMDEIRSTPCAWNEEERTAREMRSNDLSQSESKGEKPDPDLDLVAKYEGRKHTEGQSQVDYDLEQIAELFGLNVMYESFPLDHRSTSTYDGERSLREVLKDVASSHALEWTKAGKLLRVRHADWAERRSWEIPIEWVAAWQSVVEKSGELDVETLVDITTKLGDTQIEHNFTYGNPPSSSIEDPLVSRLFREAGVGSISQFRKILEMYGRLTPAQKAMMWSKDGLPFDEIANDPMWEGLTETPEFDIRLGLSRGSGKDRGGNAFKDAVALSMTRFVWLRDVPESAREQLAKEVTPEALANADSEPLRITHSAPLIQSNREQVKLLTEQIRKKRAEKAAKP